MIPIARPIAAAALIAAGVLGDRTLGPALNPPGPATQAAAAAPATTQSKNAQQANGALAQSSATLAVDAATEHAFAMASPSVVYVDNVGVGSGSGVIYDGSGDI